MALTPRECWAVLRGPLSREHPTGAWTPEHGTISMARKSFGDHPDQAGEDVFPVGLEPVVRRLLVDAGYRVVVDRAAPRPPPAADLTAIERAPPLDVALIDFVRAHDRGIVRYARESVDPAWILAQLALAFRDASFLIVGPCESQLRQVTDRLGTYGVEASWATTRSHLPVATRVVAVTPYAMALHQFEHRNRHFLIALDADAAVRSRPSWAIPFAVRARMYGLLEIDRKFSNLEADLQAELFGLDSLRIVRHGERDRPVDVHTLRIEGGPRLDHGADILTLKRRGLWRHPVRNRRIAAIARERAEHGCEPSPGVGRRGSPAASGAVVVLVESLEHAAALSCRLPRWPIVVASDAVLTGLSPRERIQIDRMRRPGPDVPDRLIATWAGLQELGRCEPGTLIRADGLGAPLPMLRLGPTTASAATGPLRIVDFRDRHHPTLRRWSRLRLAAYAGRGWSVDGTPAPDAIQRFLEGTWRP
jgi:hypothetical protein